MSVNPYQEFNEIRASRKIVANILEGKEFESVLEVGAQWGENLVAIREKFPDKRIVGIDADWDGILQEARIITGLDLRKGNVMNLECGHKEFDVVFTNALFCMLEPHQVVQGFEEIIRVAKKYIVVIELETEQLTGIVQGGRTGANWVQLFENHGIKATKRKIAAEEWGVNPWLTYGFIYYAEIGK